MNEKLKKSLEESRIQVQKYNSEQASAPRHTGKVLTGGIAMEIAALREGLGEIHQR